MTEPVRGYIYWIYFSSFFGSGIGVWPCLITFLIYTSVFVCYFLPNNSYGIDDDTPRALAAWQRVGDISVWYALFQTRDIPRQGSEGHCSNCLTDHVRPHWPSTKYGEDRRSGSKRAVSEPIYHHHGLAYVPMWAPRAGNCTSLVSYESPLSPG